MAENFRTQILNSKDGSVSTHAPVRTLGSCTFMFLRHSDLYILMVTKNNANTMMAFKYMTSVRHTPSACCVCAKPHTCAGGQAGVLFAARQRLHAPGRAYSPVLLGSLRGSARNGSRLASSRRMHPCTRNTKPTSNHQTCPPYRSPISSLPLPLSSHTQLVDLFRSYFEGALNENSVKRNFVLIYELLEETMDFGFPQLTGVAAAWHKRNTPQAMTQLRALGKLLAECSCQGKQLALWVCHAASEHGGLCCAVLCVLLLGCPVLLQSLPR